MLGEPRQVFPSRTTSLGSPVLWVLFHRLFNYVDSLILTSYFYTTKQGDLALKSQKSHFSAVSHSQPQLDKFSEHEIRFFFIDHCTHVELVCLETLSVIGWLVVMWRWRWIVGCRGIRQSHGWTQILAVWTGSTCPVGRLITTVVTGSCWLHSKTLQRTSSGSLGEQCAYWRHGHTCWSLVTSYAWTVKVYCEQLMV